MSVCRVRSLALKGIDAEVVEAEVDVSSGLPGFSIVGLPDAAVQEARERVKVAIINSGFKFPTKKVIVNLAPANLRKEGAAFDLPIALGILAVCGVVAPGKLSLYAISGELSLDGGLRGVRGALSMAEGAREAEIPALILPNENAAEASSAGGVEVFGAISLSEVVEFLRDEKALEPTTPEVYGRSDAAEGFPGESFSDVAGQAYAKRALEVAAAGGHNVLTYHHPYTSSGDQVPRSAA